LQREIEDQCADLIDINVIAINPHIVEIFGINQPFKMLLRPENYIGLISTDIFLVDLKAYFVQAGTSQV
jgi:hypothetical protein